MNNLFIYFKGSWRSLFLHETSKAINNIKINATVINIIHALGMGLKMVNEIHCKQV